MNATIKNSQQSVLLALDTESGRLIEACELVAMDEAALRDLRRASLSGVRRSGVSEVPPRLRCGLCNGPVHISMRQTEFGNRWFAHHGELTECPYRSERRMSADERLAWLYQGQQEGREHNRLKNFIADWLEKESGCASVWRDKVRHSDLNRGEWKRPDVRGFINEREVVFEIQLSYTFLSEVVRRDTFYRQEGVHILWVFREFEPHREVVRDEMFYNRRNVFVLDADAEAETIKRGRLTFKCYYQTPTLIDDTVCERWSSRYVSLDGLHYPEPAYRPYYRDFDAALLRLLRLQLFRATMQWGRVRKKRDFTEADKVFANVVSAWRILEKIGAIRRTEDFYETGFLEEHLPRLLSIKYGRPIGYRYKTVWEVLNAALNMSLTSRRPFNIVYLMAVKQFKPHLSPEHAKRIEDHRHEVRKSITAGEDRFLREERYDAAIGLIFPELQEQLDNRFGATGKNQQ